MKRMLRLTLVAGSILLFRAAALHAGDVQVIASKDVAVSEVTGDDLKRIFLGTKTSLGDAKVHPVLQQGGPAHEAFVKGYVGKSDADLQAYYKALVFAGKGVAPKVLDSDAAVVSFVAMSKGTIAYVSGSAIVMGVNKLTVK